MRNRRAGCPSCPFPAAWPGRRAEARGRRWRRRLKKTYDRLCSDPDLSQPYIYVALHYQPEQTTSPSGGVYVHQDLMVGLLASHLPSGWKIYVKEHEACNSPPGGGTSAGDPSSTATWPHCPGCNWSRPNIRALPSWTRPGPWPRSPAPPASRPLCRSKTGAALWLGLVSDLPGGAARRHWRATGPVPHPRPKRLHPPADKLRAFVAAFHQAAYPACPDSFRLRKVNISTEENAAAICQALADFCG